MFPVIIFCSAASLFCLISMWKVLHWSWLTAGCVSYRIQRVHLVCIRCRRSHPPTTLQCCECRGWKKASLSSVSRIDPFKICQQHYSARRSTGSTPCGMCCQICVAKTETGIEQIIFRVICCLENKKNRCLSVKSENWSNIIAVDHKLCSCSHKSKGTRDQLVSWRGVAVGKPMWHK